MKTLLLAIVLGFVSLTTTAQKNDQVYSIVEQMPEFPGGDEALIKFLSKTVNYPEEASNKGISATIRVSFIVDKNGSLDSVHCDKEYGYGFDEEVLRVIKLMPKWKPGYNQGTAVAVRAKLPIRFVMDPATLRKKNRKNRHSLI